MDAGGLRFESERDEILVKMTLANLASAQSQRQRQRGAAGIRQLGGSRRTGLETLEWSTLSRQDQDASVEQVLCTEGRTYWSFPVSFMLSPGSGEPCYISKTHY